LIERGFSYFSAVGFTSNFYGARMYRWLFRNFRGPS